MRVLVAELPAVPVAAAQPCMPPKGCCSVGCNDMCQLILLWGNGATKLVQPLREALQISCFYRLRITLVEHTLHHCSMHSSTNQCLQQQAQLLQVCWCSFA